MIKNTSKRLSFLFSKALQGRDLLIMNFEAALANPIQKRCLSVDETGQTFKH